MSNPIISQGRILLQSTNDGLWYFSEIVFLGDGSSWIQVAQSNTVMPSIVANSSYVVLLCPDNNAYYRFSLYNDADAVYYSLSEDNPLTQNPIQLILQNPSDGVLYRIVPTLRDGTIYAAIISGEGSTGTIGFPFKPWSLASEDVTKRKATQPAAEDTTKRRTFTLSSEDSSKRRSITPVNYWSRHTIITRT